MRTKLTFVSAVMSMFLFGVWAGSLPAQEKKSQLYLVADVTVFPSQESNFVQAAREQAALYAKYKCKYSWNVFSTDDGHYYFLFPVKNLADVENFWLERKRILKEGAEDLAFQAMLEKSKGTYEFIRWETITFDPELSHIPEAAQSPSGETWFRYWQFDYVITGYSKEYEEVVKELNRIGNEKKVAQTWHCFTGGLGTDEPLYIWEAFAKNAIDFHEKNKVFWEALGQGGVDLYGKWMKCVRKREARTGRIRVGLSYSLEKEAER